MLRTPTVCAACTHLFDQRTLSNLDLIPVCDAFPAGIPAEVLSGQLDHTVEVEGDHGVRFDEKPGSTDYVNRYYNWRNSAIAREWYGDL